MIYVARMHTRYPEFHGKGYYNFLVSTDRDDLEYQVADNSHDFSLDGDAKELEFDSIEELLKKYPNKQDLNKVFE